jgi:hypothetical protein
MLSIKVRWDIRCVTPALSASQSEFHFHQQWSGNWNEGDVTIIYGVEEMSLSEFREHKF